MIRSVLCALVCVVALYSTNPLLAQTPPAVNAVPFVSELTPPSLPVTGNSGSGSATLTILGANFPQNALVNLTFAGTTVIHPTSTTVNSTGSAITAQFTGNVPSAPAVFEVTVTNPNGTAPTTSNVFYLPQTPATPSVLLNQNATYPLTGAPQAVVAANLQANGLPSLAIVSQNPDSVSTELDIYSGFESGYVVTTGQRPYGIATGEFLLGDNLPEFAVTNSSDNTVTLLVANGTNGSYRAFSTVSLPGVFPTGVVAGDFNRDGLMDLAVVNTCGAQTPCFPQGAPTGPGSVTILLGNGDGTFSVSPAQLVTGNIPYAIAAADLNGDGILDLVIVNSTSNTLSVFMGNGDGTFTPAAASPSTGNGPMALAIGDFNNDGFLDIAVVNSNDNTVSILLNQNCPSVTPSACTFAAAPVSPQVSGGPVAIATGDLNADGLLDLVVADASANMVTVLLGNGTGAFAAVVPPQNSPNFSTGSAPDGVVLADFNQDGRLDIITSNRSGSYSVLRQAAVMGLQLTTNPSTFVYGSVPTLTVQLMPPPGAPAGPTGTVALLDSSTQITSSTLSGSQYQLQFMLPPTYFFGAGTHQLTAVYSGDTNFAPVTSIAVTETVATSATTTALSSNVTNAPYGASVTLTASIQPQAPAPATGTVTFIDTTNLTTLGTATVSSNSAQLTIPNLAVGTHSIVATYQGDANCTGSSSASVTETVTQATTTTAISATPMSSSLGQSVTFSATITSTPNNAATGSVLFLDSGTLIGTGTVSNNTAHFTTSTLAVGTHNITAQYGGDTNFAGSTSTVVTETVTPATPTIYLVLYEVSTTYGQNAGSITTVQGGPNLPTPTGTLTFMDGSTALGTASLVNGSAQFTLPLLTVGSHSISAKYIGDTNYQAGTSNASTETVVVATTTTSLSANLTSAFYGQPVTVTAAIQPQYGGAATGPVYLYDGGQEVGVTNPSNNSAVFVVSSLTAGSHSLSAYYNGDKNTYASGSGGSPVALTVNPSATTTTLTSTPNPSNYGQTVTLTFNVKPAYGTFQGSQVGQISFFDGSTLITTMSFVGSGSQIGVSLAAGAHSITAQYLGTSNYLTSTSVPVSQTVNQAQSATTLTVTPNPATYGQSATATASLSSPYGFSGAGNVTLYDGSTSIGSASVSAGATTANFALSLLTAGTHSLTAKYSGDANYLGSTSSAVTETVNQASSTASVSSNVNPATFGQSVTFTATVSPSYSGSATGTFTFFDGTTSLGTATIANNTAQLSVSTLTVGSHSITVKYSGDANDLASTSSAITQTVNQAVTTTTLASSLNPSAYGQTASLTATVQLPSGVSATGTVTFFDGTTSLGSATLTGNAAQMTIASLAAGTHSLTASYNGNSNLLASTSTAVSQVVSQASTTTTVSSSANPASVGQAVVFTASVQAAFGGTAGGSVSFYDGTALLGTVSLTNNSTQLSVSTLGAGSHSITATYNGDANTATSTSSALPQTVNPAATATTYAVSPNPSVFNQSVSFVITVSPAAGGTPTGTVSLMDGSTTLTTAALSGGTARIYYGGLSPATHSMTAVYSGDANFTASTSAAQNVVVNQASTTTVVSSNLNPSTYGQAVTLTATVQAPQGINPFGTVTFMDGSSTLGSSSLSNGSAQLPLSGLVAGSHTIAAVYGGNPYLTGSTSASLAQSVSAASSATTVSSSVNPAVFGQTVVLSAAIQPAFGGSGTGTVTFLDGAVALGSSPVAGNAAQLSLSSLTIGSHTITAKYNGDGNVTGSTSATLAQTIGQAVTTATVTSGSNPAVFGQSVTFSVRIQSSWNGTPTGTVTLLDGSNSLGSTALPANGVAQFTISSLALGSHAISASYNGDTNFAPSTAAALTETINQASTTTTVTSATNPAMFDQSVVFSVRVQSSSSGTPTGTVTLLDGSNSLGSTALPANGVAQFTISSLALGSHAISASYSGDTNFAPSTAATLTETINQASTTVTVTSGTNPSAVDQAVIFTVKIQPSSGGTPTGTVTLLDGSSSLGSASLPTNGVVQFTVSTLLVGSHSIAATYSGDNYFLTSTSTAFTQTVSQAPTTTAVTSSANPSAYGQALTFTASVATSFGGSPTGTVTFFDGGTQIGSASVSGGFARFTAGATALNAGTHSVVASYSGDANFTGSSSATWGQTVNAAVTSTTLVSSLDPSVFGQSITFIATVSSAVSGTQSGTVSFYVDGSTTAAQTSILSGGTAQFSNSSLAGGTHSVTAAFASTNSNFQGSSSAALTQNVEDFSASASPASLTISRGHSGTSTLTVSPVLGFTGSVSLSCSGAPANTTCSLSPTQVSLSGSPVNSTVTVHANQKATAGNYTLTLTGVSGSLSHTTRLTLTVQ